VDKRVQWDWLRECRTYATTNCCCGFLQRFDSLPRFSLSFGLERSKRITDKSSVYRLTKTRNKSSTQPVFLHSLTPPHPVRLLWVISNGFSLVFLCVVYLFLLQSLQALHRWRSTPLTQNVGCPRAFAETSTRANTLEKTTKA
ncbi:unnamed protein product, partial [Ectocarpus sp. 12 AP-2014]